MTIAPTAAAAAAAPRPTLQLADYLALPITGDIGAGNTRGQLARVNFMRDEPGGRRFFINDLNGPLYILDKRTKQLTTYLDFNGLGDRPACSAVSLRAQLRHRPDRRRLRSRLRANWRLLHDPHGGSDRGRAGRAAQRPRLRLDRLHDDAGGPVPGAPGVRIDREGVIVEWTDRNIRNATFEGTARELLRIQLPSPIHPVGDLTFDPTARPGDPEWRVMYIGSGDAGTGEQRDIRTLTPQRLDTLNGKILRIIPDLRAHSATSTVSENGRYRVPNDNPFTGIDGARKEIWALGIRNPHRLVWDVDPARPRRPRLLAFDIGLAGWETVFIVEKGANLGYPLREGPQAMTIQGMAPVPADDTIPLRVTDTITHGMVTPIYPVIAYPHTASGGDAIAGGAIYRGQRIPALKGRLILGDITTGKIWAADMADVRKAHDGKAETLAPLHELDAGLRAIVERTFHARGRDSDPLPGAAGVSGRGRVDLRIAQDSAGELYLLTKTDGMIRQVVGLK